MNLFWAKITSIIDFLTQNHETCFLFWQTSFRFVIQKVQKSSEMSTNVQKCPKSSKNVQKSPKKSKNVQKVQRVQRVQKSSEMSRNVQKRSKNVQKSPKLSKLSKKAQKCPKNNLNDSGWKLVKIVGRKGRKSGSFESVWNGIVP